MSQITIDIINCAYKFLMLLVLAWATKRVITWIFKTFIPATKELLNDFREMRRQNKQTKK